MAQRQPLLQATEGMKNKAKEGLDLARQIREQAEREHAEEEHKQEEAKKQKEEKKRLEAQKKEEEKKRKEEEKQRKKVEEEKKRKEAEEKKKQQEAKKREAAQKNIKRSEYLPVPMSDDQSKPIRHRTDKEVDEEIAQRKKDIKDLTHVAEDNIQKIVNQQEDLGHLQKDANHLRENPFHKTKKKSDRSCWSFFCCGRKEKEENKAKQYGTTATQSETKRLLVRK